MDRLIRTLEAIDYKLASSQVDLVPGDGCCPTGFQAMPEEQENQTLVPGAISALTCQLHELRNFLSGKELSCDFPVFDVLYGIGHSLEPLIA